MSSADYLEPGISPWSLAAMRDVPMHSPNDDYDGPARKYRSIPQAWQAPTPAPPTAAPEAPQPADDPPPF